MVAGTHTPKIPQCPQCGGPADDHYFDRSFCPCDDIGGGVMHTRCRQCGFALDGCRFDDPRKEPE